MYITSLQEGQGSLSSFTGSLHSTTDTAQSTEDVFRIDAASAIKRTCAFLDSFCTCSDSCFSWASGKQNCTKQTAVQQSQPPAAHQAQPVLQRSCPEAKVYSPRLSPFQKHQRNCSVLQLQHMRITGGIFQRSCAVLTLRTSERTTWLSQRTILVADCWEMQNCTRHQTASDGIKWPPWPWALRLHSVEELEVHWSGQQPWTMGHNQDAKINTNHLSPSVISK